MPVIASLKLPENQQFEIVGFLALLGRILWFDPRREHSSIPTANSRSRRAQGLSRLAASSRPPAGLGLDWPEHGGRLDRLGLWCRSSAFLFAGAAAQAVALELDAMSVVNDAIQYRIAEGRVGNDVVPLCHGDLTCDQE